MDLVFYLPDNVQIIHCRFYHDNIRSLFYIQKSFFNSFSSVMEVHLIALSVAESRGRTCCITERSVKGRGIFHCIRHNGNIPVAVLIQDGADSPDSSVHHIRGRYHIRSSLCMRKSCLGQIFQGFVIVHFVSTEDAAMSMGSILTHTYIGDQI